MPPELQDWISIFQGILVEATPFLLLGVAVSALVHVFISEDRLLRLVPRNPVLSLVPALAVGMLMPVCECGNVAVARRFLVKGVPISSCIAFLLAAPILNPVALFATATAFRYDPSMVWLRGSLAFLVAAVAGLLIGRWGQGENLLAAGVLQESSEHSHHHHDHHHGVVEKVREAAHQAGGEFLSMMQVLVIGAGLAAATQVIVPRDLLTSVAGGIVFAILAMMTLGFILSICSTVDAFFALSFAGFFPTPALLAFLVFGPMISLKSVGMMLTAFRPKAVLAMVVVAMEMVFLSSLLLNLRGVLS